MVMHKAGPHPLIVTTEAMEPNLGPYIYICICICIYIYIYMYSYIPDIRPVPVGDQPKMYEDNNTALHYIGT